ncbi:hypothetical protein [Streptacidiphilus jiangxiensis]|uniref:Uncharacterized protein n=1 Tax=Streptacidiphilus jiangxiensis TaxID=235985 RepID=A0A1H7RRH6_STRJI|nr:hypothetical protein [Streptacidiphilus jiangxiensis]SEL62414.1 hypothetical protein SAMN05414137_110261 [Streptacidiphilus jiangxiensis]
MSGFVELVRGLRWDPVPAPLPAVVADDPAEEIAARFAPVAAGAVHAWELVAAIEAEGLTDRQIQQRYGRRDAFELGEELFRRAHPEAARPRAEGLPRRVRARLRRGSRASAWGVPVSRSALRGVLFALPGLAFVLAAPPSGGLWCAGSALLFSWSWSQAVAHLGYVRLGRGDREGAAASMARGGVAGVVLCLVVAGVVAPLTGATAAAVGFAVGQALYFASATALLVLGGERALAAALAPVALGAAWLLVARPTGLPGPPGALGPVLVLLSLALAVRAGWRGTGGPASWAGERDRPAVGAEVTVRPREWSGAAQAGAFGLAVAVLTLARIGPATVALTLSMGGAEWFLARCRATTELALGRAGAAGEFRGLVLGALARCLGGYVLLVAGLAWLAEQVWPGSTGPGVPGLAALAAAIWSAQLLQSLGLLPRATLGVCVAAVALVAARVAGVAPGTAQVGVSVAAAAALCALAALAVTTATRHR